MFHLWHILLRTVLRRVLVVAGALLVALAPVQMPCAPCIEVESATASGSSTGWLSSGDDGCGSPCEPEQCDHCHCSTPAAVAPDPAVQLPAALVSRHNGSRTADLMPDDPSFVPDPPPNRA